MQFFFFFSFFCCRCRHSHSNNKLARSRLLLLLRSRTAPCLTSNNTRAASRVSNEPAAYERLLLCVCISGCVCVCEHSGCACVCLWEHVYGNTCVYVSTEACNFSPTFFSFFSAPVRRQSSRSASIAGCCMSMPIKTSSWRRSPAYDEPVYMLRDDVC